MKRILSSIILIPVILYLLITGSYLFKLFVLICFFITIYEWHMISKNKIYSLPGYLFILISFYTFLKLREDFDLMLVLIIMLICISTDLGGYFFGKFFKGPKITKISPNKTYTGVFGSFLLPIFFMYIFFNLDFKLVNKVFFNSDLFVFILIISSVSQLGDIFISYFKRLVNIKDTGKIIPGHGGILDRIDGMLFVFPISYFLVKNNFFQII